MTSHRGSRLVRVLVIVAGGIFLVVGMFVAALVLLLGGGSDGPRSIPAAEVGGRAFPVAATLSDVAVGGEVVWALEERFGQPDVARLHAVDPATGRVVGSVAVGQDVSEVAAREGLAITLSRTGGHVTRVVAGDDPEVEARTTVDGEPAALAVVGDEVWLVTVGDELDPGDDRLVVLDAGTLRPRGTPRPVPGIAADVVGDRDGGWVLARGRMSDVQRVEGSDPTDTAKEIGANLERLALGEETLWAFGQTGVVGLDARSGAPRGPSQPLPRIIDADAGGPLAVALDLGGRLYVLAPDPGQPVGVPDATAVTVGDDKVWVADRRGRLTAFDRERLEVATR